MESGTQIALFALIVGVFTLMGGVFWLIGHRELRRQREAASARQRPAPAEVIAVFELAAAADRAALDARKRELGLDLPEAAASVPSRAESGG